MKYYAGVNQAELEVLEITFDHESPVQTNPEPLLSRVEGIFDRNKSQIY